MCHLVQLTSSCTSLENSRRSESLCINYVMNYFNQPNFSKMTIILILSKFIKRILSLTYPKIENWPSSLSCPKSAKWPVWEYLYLQLWRGYKHQIRGAGTLTYVLWKWYAHTCSGTPLISSFRVDAEVRLPTNYSLLQADIEK